MSELWELFRRARVRLGRLLASELLLRLVYAFLRRFAPKLSFRGYTVMTRFDDVKEVLGNHAIYTVRSFGVRMRETAGDFFLGHDDDPQYWSDKRLADTVMGEVSRLRPNGVFDFANLRSRAVVDGRRQMGDTLDVVRDLADDIPVLVVEDYFGVPNPGSRRLLEWVQEMSWYVFNPLPSAGDRERGVLAGKLLREHVDRLLRTPQPPPPARRLLDGLRLQAPHEDVVARTICGLVAGTLGPPPLQFVYAVDQLLRLSSQETRRLHDAAVKGDQQTVTAYLCEASRLAPQPGIIYRTCEKTGRTILCMIDSALMDGRRGQIAHPRKFVPGRPVSEQMFLGHGLHACMGKAIGLALLAGMAMPLFALPGLRRVPGREGRIQKGVPGRFPSQNYPQHLLVCYDV